MRFSRPKMCYNVFSTMPMVKADKIIFFLFMLMAGSMPDASAMHIAEGMLSFKWCAAWWLAAIPVVFSGLRNIKRLKDKQPLYLPLVSTVAAAVFVLSMLPLPVPATGATSHPTVTGLSAILLGVLSTSVVSFISLFMQAVFLGHGGLTTLGANVFSMGVIGPVVAISVFLAFKKSNAPVVAGAFAAGFLADLSTYAVTSLQLAFSLVAPDKAVPACLKFMAVFLPVQLPIAIAEGLFTAGIIKYICVHKPGLISHLIPSPGSGQ